MERRNSVDSWRLQMPMAGLLLAFLLAPGTGAAGALQDWIAANCNDCLRRMEQKTGAYILERGDDALIARAWLAQHAEESIDVQYFIWSTDNVGILAAEHLLRAAGQCGARLCAAG